MASSPRGHGVCDFAEGVLLHDFVPPWGAEHDFMDEKEFSVACRKLQALKNMDFLLTKSEATRRAAISTFGLDPDRVVHVSSAVDDRFKDFAPAEGNVSRVLGRCGISRPFVLSFGSLEQDNRNVEGLLGAYALLPDALRKARPLCILQPNAGGSRAGFESLLTKSGLGSDEVVFTGFMPVEDRAALYKACELFVLPSLREDFALPALEAMTCGAPVIASNCSSIPEVIGLEDALFDAGEPACIAAKIQEVLENDGFLERLRENALKQAAGFSWDESARRVIDAFEAIHAARTGKKSSTTPAVRNQPRLAYISPLPPEKSGIAEYSAELIPFLARFYDITLISNVEQLSEPWLHENFPLHSGAWFEENAHHFERILYHFGNSSFHAHMFTLLEKHPGVVVLHDFYLGDVLNWMEHTGYKADAYRKELFRSHGFGALAFEMQNGRESGICKYPTNRHVLEHAMGIICHSNYAIELAQKWYGEEMRELFLHIPHLRVLPSELERNKARLKLGLCEDDFLICSFGLLYPQKLNHILLDAWLGSLLASDRRCRLVYVGESHGPYGAGLSNKITASLAADRITITGFAPRDLYRTYLEAADLAVQLRTNTRGETSGTVLDCLAHGIPLIVNAHGPMEEYPEDVLVKLRDQFDIRDLIAALDRLREDPDFRRELSVKAIQYIRGFHDANTIGERYFRAIEDFATKGRETRYRKLLHALAERSVQEEPIDMDLRRAAASIALNRMSRGTRKILFDVSVIIKKDIRTGIERVTRSLLKQLLLNPPEGYCVEPVYFKDGSCFTAPNFAMAMIDRQDIVFQDEIIEPNRGDIFLAIQLAAGIISENEALLDDWSNRGVEIYFMVHDLLPALRPDVFPNDGTEEVFERWLHIISRVSTGLVSASRAVADELALWFRTNPPKRHLPLRIGYSHHGADLAASVPTSGIPKEAPSVLEQLGAWPSLLMVGTIEPRKGHAQVVDAFDRLWGDGVEANLVIVGYEGWKGLEASHRKHIMDMVERLRRHPQAGKRLFWLEGISDEYLEKIYAACTALLFASEGEGFGLPLIEAAQYGLPLIARDIPVFREVAGEHAFYFDGKLPEDLAAAIKAWLKLNVDGRVPHSDKMPWLTWKQSAEKLLRFITGGESLFEVSDSYASIASIPFEINFRSKGNNSRSFVEHGLSNPEPWGTWSCSKDVKISFNFKNKIKKNLLLKIRFNVNCTNNYIQIFNFILNGHLIQKIEYKTAIDNEFILDISNFIQKHNELIINIPNAISPYKLGTNNDMRVLGIGLISMELM